MHEMGIMTGVMDATRQAAEEAGASKVLKVNISIGEMTEAIEDALEFAWEVLCETDPFFEGAQLEINMVRPKSICLECGAEFEHDRFHMFCPECDSFMLKLVAGREKQIDSIEVDLPPDSSTAPEDGCAVGEATSEAPGAAPETSSTPGAAPEAPFGKTMKGDGE